MSETSHRPPGRTGTTGNIGVLLVNLGTPEATDYWSMRRYLKEFLSFHRKHQGAAVQDHRDLAEVGVEELAGP